MRKNEMKKNEGEENEPTPRTELTLRNVLRPRTLLACLGQSLFGRQRH